MGKKMILGLVGSPRRLGNCEVMIKEISKNVPEEHTLRLVRVPALDIRPCKACYACVMGKPCPNDDDTDFLLQLLTEADGIIAATPVYFLGAHSMFKRILDRGFLLYRILRQTYGKPCILLNLYGMKDRLGVSPHTLLSFAAFLGLSVKADENVEAALPGEAILEERHLAKARELANRLFSKEGPAPRKGCPFCGCSIVRMEEGRFVCALCHGTFILGPSGVPHGVKEGGILGSPDHMLRHADWLRSMKERFMARKKEIMRATLQYKDVGEWVEPSRKDPGAPGADG